MFQTCKDKFHKFIWYNKSPINRLNESYLVSFKTLLVIRTIICILTSFMAILCVFFVSYMFDNVFKFLTNWGAFGVFLYYLFVCIENY